MKLPTRIISAWAGRISRLPAVNRRLMAMFHTLMEHPSGRRLLDKLFARSKWYCLLLAHSLRKSGDDYGAFRVLMLGHRSFTQDSRLHIKISEIHRDNGNIHAAHTHLRTADLIKSGYSTIRRLTFETDHLMFAQGSETMRKVLEFSEGLLRRHITMLNRISIYYPEHREKLNAVRESVRQALLHDPKRNTVELSWAVSAAISNRWLRMAIEMRNASSHDLLPPVAKLLSRLESDLGEDLLMLDIAWENELSDELSAIRAGQRVRLASAEVDSDKVVELFIPTSFFATPEHEKPTYETIRRAFCHVIRHLKSKPSLIIVPRLQLYWKDCFPKTQGARVISYHTHASMDSRRIHIQESPLAGHCSFDHAGFAGFSSIATDHEEIRRFVSSVSDEALELNQRAMYEHFVTNNVSKYLQPTGGAPITGPYVFVALQIPTDIVARLAWMSGVELLQGVVGHYRGTGVRVVVKRHPYCGSMKMQQCLDELEAAGEIIRSVNSIHSLVADALAVLTVNSGVGLEALIHGKTVIVSGVCDYSYAAITVRSNEALREVLSGSLQTDTRRIRELLYYYVHRFALPVAGPDAIHKRIDEWLGDENARTLLGNAATDAA